MASFGLTFKEVFWKEFRHCLRDKDVFIYTVIVPALVYPLLMLIFSEVMMFQGEADKVQKLKIALSGPQDENLIRVADYLKESGKYELFDLRSGGAEQALISGQVAAVMSCRKSGAAFDPERKQGLKYASPSKNGIELQVANGFKSIGLTSDLNDDIEAGYRKKLSREFADRGFSADNLKVFDIQLTNIDPQKHNTLSPLLALLAFSLCTMVLGAAYPAIACGAEEFERKTIETSCLLPVPRFAVLLGKLTSVTTFGACAGLLNAGSTLIMASSISEQLKKLVPAVMQDTTIRLDLSQIVAMLLCYFLLAVTVSALLILVSSLCRTVRSAQHWISFPLTLIMVMPALVIIPSVELNGTTALIPALNLCLVIKSLFNGVALNWSTALAVGISIFLIGLSLRAAMIFLFDGLEPAGIFIRRKKVV